MRRRINVLMREIDDEIIVIIAKSTAKFMPGPARPEIIAKL